LLGLHSLPHGDPSDSATSTFLLVEQGRLDASDRLIVYISSWELGMEPI
jgi:hypothetical protein